MRMFICSAGFTFGEIAPLSLSSNPAELTSRQANKNMTTQGKIYLLTTTPKRMVYWWIAP